MKYDRRALLPFWKDVDVMKLLKGNDEHAYIYVGGEERAVLRLLHESGGVGRGCVQEGTSSASNGKRTDGGGHGGEDEIRGGTIGRRGRSTIANRYGLSVRKFL